MDFKSQQNKVITELGLEKCKYIWSEEIVNKITQSNDKIDFFTAFKKAIHSFLTDGSKDDSFYGLISEMPENYGLSNPAEDSSIQKVIQENLNNASTKIILVTPETQFQPEEGEDPIKNWIFLVEDTQMTPGLNWAIVNRQSGEVINYGKN
jgi:hypothetical protein